MLYKIAIDADSIVYKSCHRCQVKGEPETFDIEKAYVEFCGEIAKICSDVFIRGVDSSSGLFQYETGDRVEYIICLSPRKSFRNKISPSGINFRIDARGNRKDVGYKANRKPSSVVGISELKKLILSRIPSLCWVNSEAEADDLVNYLAREKQYLVAAIDKDVINANPTYCYDYNNRKWNEPRSKDEIENWYLEQTLMGDSTDNVQGAKGIGPKNAVNIVRNELKGKGTLEDLRPYFDSELDLQVNHMLVRMDRFDGNKIIPWDM